LELLKAGIRSELLALLDQNLLDLFGGCHGL
jgi:hypothetical protein